MRDLVLAQDERKKAYERVERRRKGKKKLYER